MALGLKKINTARVIFILSSSGGYGDIKTTKNNSTFSTSLALKMTVFRVVVPCSLVEDYHCFRGAYCLHHRGDYCPDDGSSKHL
jgi:hypothetical protein